MQDLKPIFRPEINYQEILSTLDWVIFFSVLSLTYFAVFMGHRLKNKSHQKSKEEETLVDIILMGRELTLPFFVATLVATWYGGIFGVTQITFEKGIFNFVTQGVFWYFTYIIFALFLVHRINKFEALTLPELVGKMFGPKSQKLSAIFNLLNVLPIAYVISVGLLIQTLFGGSLLLTTTIGVIFVITYSIGGGFRAIVFSDFMQFFVMITSVFLVVAISAAQFGTLDYFKMNLPATHFDPMGGESLLTVFSWGLIALATLVDPSFYQRCFAAKSDKVAKKGILLATIIWFGFDICTTAGGLYARAAIPDAPSNRAYLIYALQILPHGLRGFILAGILTTVISTMDSFLFIAGTTLTYDLLPSSLNQKKWIHHLGIAAVGAISILLSLYFDGNIKHVWKTLGSIAAACLLIPMIFGHLFPGKFKDNNFVFSAFCATIAMSYWNFTEHHGFWREVDSLYVGMMASLLGLFIQFPKKLVKS